MSEQLGEQPPPKRTSWTTCLIVLAVAVLVFFILFGMCMYYLEGGSTG